MEIKAITNQTRISPRKVRLVADSIRNMSIDDALLALRVTKKRGAYVLTKTLTSALANAQNNNKIERANLRIMEILVSDGPALKRYHASTRGRIHPYKRRSTNLQIILKEVTK